jgi:hypothetical protein
MENCKSILGLFIRYPFFVRLIVVLMKAVSRGSTSTIKSEIIYHTKSSPVSVSDYRCALVFHLLLLVFSCLFCVVSLFCSYLVMRSALSVPVVHFSLRSLLVSVRSAVCAAQHRVGVAAATVTN